MDFTSVETTRQRRSRATVNSAAFDAARRWRELGLPEARAELFDTRARRRAAVYANNIESYIGAIQVPLGIAGPLQVNGEGGERAYRVPLATTEAALVASYSRGSRVVTAAGGARARVVASGVGRTPVFAFGSVLEACRFADFVRGRMDELANVVATVTTHGRLIAATPTIEGNKVYVDLRYTTGDAAGQNMVTFASDAVCRALLRRAPVRPRHWFLEANLSGDKKATARTLCDVRGRRVVAEATIPAAVIAERLHTTPESMVDYWYAGAVGAVMSGATGMQGHFANGLAALYLACGLDVACVAESAVGITRLQTTRSGDLYASVTLPNVMVGTVGGGTGLPSARACLTILGLAGDGTGDSLAEVCAALLLAGELSIVAAFCCGDFAAAHRALSRGETFEQGQRRE